ncbi:uncharacterized protein E5676_scaffold832G001760 [Cucumis melo var. makuwa]|nr:uncharacterized protein E6C27_scaffold379G00070 [Cucumis melo var. makuwa]TYK13972.1 uncharacterized protein E5676_scaffold832G001760 [Cucumis melo var. makuwa]
MDPRISFSNDFVETKQPLKLENIYREAPVSSDFEFSVKDRCMISADEIFFQGKLLPLKDSLRNHVLVKTTLRDELQVNEEEDDISFPKFTKISSSSCWKEKFGFRKPHFVAKKQSRNEVVLKTVEEEDRTSVFLHEDLINIARKNG